MKRIICTVIFAILSVQIATAADLPIKSPRYDLPSFSWTGLYIGAGGGYGVGQLQGGFGAITAGINLQSDLFRSNWPLVYSLESDLTFGDLAENSSCGGSICTFRDRWINTIRGRVGYMVDKTLFFATGGFAFGDINASGPLGSASVTKAGYAFGGGIEFSLTDNWSVRGDYLHVDLGNGTCNVCDATSPSLHSSTDEFRIQIVYRFFEEPITTLFSARTFAPAPSLEPPPIKPPPP